MGIIKAMKKIIMMKQRAVPVEISAFICAVDSERNSPFVILYGFHILIYGIYSMGSHAAMSVSQSCPADA